MIHAYETFICSCRTTIVMTLKSPLFGIVENFWHQITRISENGLHSTPELHTLIMIFPCEINIISWRIHDSVKERPIHKRNSCTDTDIMKKRISIDNLVEEGRIWQLLRL